MPAPLPPPPTTPTEGILSKDRRASAARAVAIATVLVVPSLYTFRLMSFSHAKLAGLAAGATALAFLVRPERMWQRGTLLPYAPLAILVMWAVLVAAARGEFFYEGSGAGVGSAAAIVLVGAVSLLSAASAADLQRSVALSAVPVAVLALGQYAGVLRGMFPQFPEYDQRMYSVFGNQDLLGGYLAIGLAIGFALWLGGELKWPFAVLCFATAAPALALSASRSAWLAALAGGALAIWQGRSARRKIFSAAIGVIAVVAIAAIAAPERTLQRVVGTFAQADAGYRIRLWIWDGTLHLIRQHPIGGVGLGNFAYHSPRALGEVLHERGPGAHLFNHIHTQHTHSDVLEIATDAGVVGILLLAVFVWLVPRTKSAAWPGLAAAFSFALVNTTVHSPPHLLAVLLLAGTMATRGVSPGFTLPERRWRRICPVGTAATCVLAAAIVLWPSALHARAQAEYEVQGADAERMYLLAANAPGNHLAAQELAVLYARDGRIESAILLAEQASHGLDTGELNYLRAYLAERLRGQEEASRFYRECLLRWPDYAPAYAGLLRNTGREEREPILAKAREWLSENEFTALTSPATAQARP